MNKLFALACFIGVSFSIGFSFTINLGEEDPVQGYLNTTYKNIMFELSSAKTKRELFKAMEQRIITLTDHLQYARERGVQQHEAAIHNLKVARQYKVKIHALRQIIAKLNFEGKEQEQLIAKLNQTISENEEKFQQIVSNLKAEHQQELSRLESRIKELEEENLKLRTEIGDFRQTIELMQSSEKAMRICNEKWREQENELKNLYTDDDCDLSDE